jgi:hypothetical protein
MLKSGKVGSVGVKNRQVSDCNLLLKTSCCCYHHHHHHHHIGKTCLLHHNLLNYRKYLLNISLESVKRNSNTEVRKITDAPWRPGDQVFVHLWLNHCLNRHTWCPKYNCKQAMMAQTGSKGTALLFL